MTDVEAVAARLAGAVGEAPLTDADITALLELARDVAHATDRRLAPLSTFLAGMAVASSEADRALAIAAAAERLRGALPADG